MDQNQKHLANVDAEVNFDAMVKAELGQTLTPFFCIDDVFSPKLLALCLNNWPDYDNFSPVLATDGSFELPLVSLNNFIEGNFQDKLNVAQGSFWQAFLNVVIRRIVSLAAYKFSPFIVPRFPQMLGDLEINTFSLRCVDQSYTGLAKHVHYYHDPMWTFTLLFYLDDTPEMNRGLNMYRFNYSDTLDPDQAIDEITRLVSPQCTPAEREASLRLEETVPYKANRLLMVLDSPSSWHGVGPFDQGVPGWGRRHIVTHVMIPRANIARKFGVTPESWTEKYTSSLDEDILRHLRSDVACGLNPAEL